MACCFLWYHREIPVQRAGHMFYLCTVCICTELFLFIFIFFYRITVTLLFFFLNGNFHLLLGAIYWQQPHYYKSRENTHTHTHVGTLGHTHTHTHERYSHQQHSLLRQKHNTVLPVFVTLSHLAAAPTRRVVVNSADEL